MKPQSLIILLFSLGFSVSAFAQDDANAATQKKLDTIRISELSFKDASLFDIVDFLIVTSRERDPTKEGVNIVLDFQTPPPRVSISLRQVSLGDAIDFIADITNLESSIRKGIVVIKEVTPKEEKMAARLATLKTDLKLTPAQAKIFDAATADIQEIAGETQMLPPLPIPPGGGGDFFDDFPFDSPSEKK